MTSGKFALRVSEQVDLVGQAHGRNELNTSLPHQLQLLFSQVAWVHCDLPTGSALFKEGRAGQGKSHRPSSSGGRVLGQGFLNYFLLHVDLPHWLPHYQI